ncbi:MAG: NAD(+)/NADH kinase [Elusimicrobia bacterium]|nr:NAD(+)/NADH kinase [Elusimicrobiota bacterium]
MKTDIAARADEPSIRSAILFYNEQKPEAVRWLRKVQALLKARGLRVWMGSPATLRERLPMADIVVAMGGDGTMLRAARLVAPRSVPLLGINTGGLGFLSGTDAQELNRHIGTILEGRFVLEERWMLSVEATRGARKVFGPAIALNDCVIRCGDQARAITLQASCANLFVANYFGDGLILSTPTGSTAYALAAGGPVVDPRLDAFLIAPICPHTLTQRPLILPAKEPVVVTVSRRQPQENPQILISLDGQVGCSLRVGSQVTIRRYEKPLKLLVNPKRSYFQVLRSKLKWGER